MRNIDSLFQTFEKLEYARTIGTGIPPNPPKEREVEALRAAFGQVGARAAAVADESLEHAPKARPPREVEEDHGVGPFEAGVVAVEVEEVAVEDPALAGDRGGEVTKRLVAWSRCPAGAPEEDVEVHDREPRPAGDRGRELGLARASGPEDHDALHRAGVLRARRSARPARSALRSPPWRPRGTSPARRPSAARPVRSRARRECPPS